MPGRKYPAALLDEAARLRETGLSFAQIGRRLDMHSAAVKYHCLRLGADSPDTALSPPPRLTLPEYSRGGHVVRHFTAEEDARLLRLEAKGLSVMEIARHLNRHRNSVRGRLMTLARHEARHEARAAMGEGLTPALRDVRNRSGDARHFAGGTN